MTETNNNDQIITKLEGVDRVRLRPAVVFGSDGLDGCCRAFFEMLSIAVNEVREGFGNIITVTVFADRSVKIEDMGRGLPLDYNEKYSCYNWDIVFCGANTFPRYVERFGDLSGVPMEFFFDTKWMGAYLAQCASEFFEVYSYDGKSERHMSFKKGRPSGDMQVKALDECQSRTGTVIHWRSDLEVFADIAIPRTHYEEVLQNQAAENQGLSFIFRWENEDGSFETKEYVCP